MPRNGCLNACCASFCGAALSYNSVRLVTIRNVKVGLFNRLLQLIVVVYSTYALLVSRAYMEKEIPTGAQDVFGEMEYTVPTQLPPYCDNAAWNYYFSSFWNYRDIGCVPPTSLEVLVPGTNEIFVITEVEEHVTVKKNCTATNCDVQDDVTNTFIIDPENSVYVSFHHAYKTTWGATEFDIAAELVATDGTVLGTAPSGGPPRFLVADFIKAAGVQSLDQEATVGGNKTSSTQPRYRLIGVNIGVELEYTNVNGAIFDDTVRLQIKPFNRENGWAQIIRPPQYIEYPNKMRTLVVQGAKFTFEVAGTIGRFSVGAVVTWLVNTVVLVGMSRVATDLAAFNFLGDDSKQFKVHKSHVVGQARIKLGGASVELADSRKPGTDVVNPLHGHSATPLTEDEDARRRSSVSFQQLHKQKHRAGAVL